VHGELYANANGGNQRHRRDGVHFEAEQTCTYRLQSCT
jgi:hypothetical protein